MFKEQGNPAALLVESPQAAASKISTIDRDQASSAAPPLSAAMVGADPVSASTLRHMLMQTAMVKDVQDWASPSAVELRSPQEVPDVVFVNLSGDDEADFAF